jgi:PAS domain S-box-containing protein
VDKTPELLEKIKYLEIENQQIKNELNLTKQENKAITDKYLEIVNNLEKNVINKNEELIHYQRTLENTLYELQIMLDYSPAIIFFKDIKLNFVRVNRPFLSFFNLKISKVIGHNQKSLFKTEYFNESDELFVIQNAKSLLKRDCSIQINNKAYYFEVNILPVFAENHQISGIVCFALDVTDLTKIKNDNLVLLNHLNTSQKHEALGTLAGGISHDFNNILSAIIGYTEIANNFVEKPDKIKKYLSEVLFASNRAKELIKQILTFSRKSSKEIQPINLIDCIEESLKLIRPTIPSIVDINLQINIKHALIAGNDIQIKQILLNLCTNAWHAMQGKPGIINIILEQIDVDIDTTLIFNNKITPGIYYKLTVSDNGSGIPKNILNKVFDPYFTTKNKDQGTGLGLSVVLGIVSEHNGSIEVISEPRKGTKFEIFLPKIDSIHIEKPKELHTYQYGKGSILFVDDEPSINFLMQDFLSKLGYDVDIFNDSLEAFEYYVNYKDKYNLIFTDLIMPKSDGFDLIKKIKAIDNKIPIILCSGYHNEESEKMANDLLVDAILKKPLDFHEISIKIQDLINHNN